MSKRQWCGSAPKRCDVCNDTISGKFYDARTTLGPWANMCPECFSHGIGIGKLGPGMGQEYTKQSDGGYLKTGG